MRRVGLPTWQRRRITTLPWRLGTCITPHLYCAACAFHQTLCTHSSFSYRKTRVASEDAINPLTKPTNIDRAALHVVSVPIGNLKDFTLRALDVLRDVDYIVTSDRPATKTLLDLVHIPSQGRLIHYSRGNRAASTDKLVELLRGGRSMALVTTSGTPCVGDIGSDLVQAMQQCGIRVSAVPGASAVMSALAVSGLTESRYEKREEASSTMDVNARRHRVDTLRDGSFFFGNMLPESHAARLRLLRSVVGPATFPCVFYEIPRRLLIVMQDIAALLPKRRVCVTHELTKLNESLHMDTAERLVVFYMKQEAQTMLNKGQLVIIIDGAGPEETSAWLLREALKRRRMRRDINDLVPATQEGGGDAAPASVSENTKPKRSRRSVLLRRRRQRLIRQIEQEQEKLRLSMSINRSDAQKLF